MTKKIFLLALCFYCTFIYGQNEQFIDSISKRAVKVQNSHLIIFDVITLNEKDWKSLYRVPEHPAFDILLTDETEKQILKDINLRRNEIGKDTLLASDIFYIWKPYFDWLHYHDPHYRVSYLWGSNDPQNKQPKIRTPVFSYLCVNDTVIVDVTYGDLLQKGDMILSLNNIDIAKYLSTFYSDRYNDAFQLMRSHYFNYPSDTVNIKLQRAGKLLNIKMPTIKLSDWYKTNYNVQVFKDAKCGYINIEQFYNDNTELIKTVHSSIKKFKKKGCTNVILDLRKNPGGYGDSFDKLISIFVNKPTILYQKGAKIKVSKEVLPYYDFLNEENIGQLIDLPDEEIIKSFETIPEMYIDGIQYYVLISQNTGSVAASFANILQYNNAAKLVGEPLLHNANRYGEVIKGGILHGGDFVPTLLSSTGISTVENEEYTKAENGVVMPDIHIPYVASEYLCGKDAMLEKLLQILKQ